MALTELERHLLNDFQRDFPLSPTPFREIAETLGVTEGEVLASLRDLAERRIVSRVGPVFAPHWLGASTLAAMAVPEARLAEVADLVSALPEVNHNYEREHRYNLWFVLTARDQARLDEVLADLERRTGLPVLSLPMLEDFHIDLGFPLEFEEER
jgi:DNA-binding Lrp family transcriptional regulator